MFHIQKRITEAVTNKEYKEYKELMFNVVKTNKPKDIFNIIYNYKVELEYDENEEELKKVKEDETEYRNLGAEESQVYCGCRKRMKKNRTSWCDEGAEAMVKVISYIKSNLLEDIITGEMEKSIQIRNKTFNQMRIVGN